MKEFSKFELSELHLFETSLIGKAIDLHFHNNSVLIIPCYNPNFSDSEGKEYYSLFTYLVFKKFNAFKCNIEYYEENLKNFSDHKVSFDFGLDSQIPIELDYTISNMGYYNSPCWLSYIINFTGCSLYVEETYEGFNQPDILELYTDQEVLDFLMLSNFNNRLKSFRPSLELS